MSQFGFGQQIGQQRDALGGSRRSNYASEEADLTDGLIAQVNKIDIPNTNQFYENIKFVEKVKEQGNLINTVAQVARTFEAGAKFKTAFDAMKAKNDSIDRLKPGLESIDTENIANIAKQNQEIYNKEDAEEAKTANDLELEKQGSTQEHQNSILDLQYDMFHSPEKLNFRQTGNEIDGAIQITHGNLSTQTGLDRITTTGEAREFVGVNGTTGKILEGIFYEYAERGFDITNKRVQNRILARHAESILKAEQASFNTWSTNHRQKVQLAQQETLKTDVYAAVSKGDANSLFGDNGLVQQTNAIIYGGASQATSSLWVAEQIKKGIEANVIVGTEGLTISDNMIDDIFEEQPVTINGKQYNSYSDIPDNIISANVKNQTKLIVKDAMRKRQTEQANNIETDRTNFNNNFVRTNVTEFVQNLKTTEQRKLFYSSENGVNIAIRYMNEISKPENKHLAQYDSEGELIIPQEISGIFAKSDTGASDTAVSTKEDKASTFNDIEKNLITSAVKNYKYGAALEKELQGADYITVERARDDLYTRYLNRSDELQTLIENRPVGKSAKSIELDFIQKIFEKDVLPNIQKGVYDKAGTAGVTLDLIFNKGVMIEQFENNGDLQNSVVPVGLAEKNNFERSKSWLNSGRTLNKDVLSFYEDVPMFKVLSDGTKVPMTNLEKWTHRAKAIGALSDEDGDGILEYDDTRKYFTMKDLAKLRKQPTDGKYLQITADVLPNFKEALLAMKPSASSDFNTYEANFPTTGRSAPRKDNLQDLSLEQIQALVLTNDMNKIGYFELDGERLYNTINELTSKGMIKKDQKFDQNAQFYVRMYMLQKNINQRRRSLSGLTVLPFAKGEQPLTMGISGKGTDGGTTTLGNTQDDSDWLGIPNFSLNDLEIMRRVFPLMESHPMSDFATMTKDVSKIFLDELAKDGGKKFFEKDRYLQHEISRKAILDALTPKPVDTTKRKRN
jgi:hypothetical protein